MNECKNIHNYDIEKSKYKYMKYIKAGLDNKTHLEKTAIINKIENLVNRYNSESSSGKTQDELSKLLRQEIISRITAKKKTCFNMRLFFNDMRLCDT